MGRMSISLRLVLLGGLVLGGNAGRALAELQFPQGTQDFESLNVGDDVALLFNWEVVNSSAPPSNFTVTAANDVLGVPQLHNFSTRWLRVNDTDAGNVQNRFYSLPIMAPSPQSYTWTFFINLEATPPGAGATKPRFTIQHLNAGPFANAWGIEFTDTGANLVVTGIGGAAASAPLYSLASPGMGVGDWVKLELSVDFDTNTVSADANNGPIVTLPINLAATANKAFFRFCYRGEGTGNVNQMLVDDITVQVGAAQNIPTASTWGLVVLALLLAAAGTIYFNRRCERGFSA